MQARATVCSRMSALMQAPFNDHITTFCRWRDGKMHRHKPLTYCSKYEAQQYCKNGLFFTPDMHGTLENGPVHVVLGLGCREPNPRKQVARMNTDQHPDLELKQKVVLEYEGLPKDEIRLQVSSYMDDYYGRGGEGTQWESIYAPMVYKCKCHQYPCQGWAPAYDDLVDSAEIVYWSHVQHGDLLFHQLPDVFAVIMSGTDTIV